jgi:hypothetical protein
MRLCLLVLCMFRWWRHTDAVERCEMLDLLIATLKLGIELRDEFVG